MKAVLQRVTRASVAVGGEIIGEIGRGLLLLLGVAEGDTERECDFLAEKAVNLRIFEDSAGKMNQSLLDTGGGLLVVSQFTLCADCKNGRRPSFTGAARPESAAALYERFAAKAGALGVNTATGRFGAEMKVCLENDGPVTIVLDTTEILKKEFSE